MSSTRSISIQAWSPSGLCCEAGFCASSKPNRAQTPAQLLALSQEYIRPLIGMIDRLNEAGAEDELRVITKQLTQLVFRPQPFPQRQVTPRAARHADRKSRLEFCPAV